MQGLSGSPGDLIVGSSRGADQGHGGSIRGGPERELGADAAVGSSPPSAPPSSPSLGVMS